MACKHEYKGNARGVVCIKCGKEMTADEYKDSLKPKKKKTEKPAE